MNFPFEINLVLENKIALLRPLQVADIEHLLPIATSEKNLMQFVPMQIYSKELLMQYIEKSIQERENKKRYAFSIFDKSKNEFAGSTSFLNISDIDSRLEVGATWIGKSFQKTGLNRNVKFLMLGFAFDELKAERVEFKTDERNKTSRAAIEKIGGKFEGLLRSHMLMSDGFRRNSVYYSILKNEWEKMKPDFLKYNNVI